MYTWAARVMWLLSLLLLIALLATAGAADPRCDPGHGPSTDWFAIFCLVIGSVLVVLHLATAPCTLRWGANNRSHERSE